MSKIVTLVAVSALALACTAESPEPTAPFSVPVFSHRPASAGANGGNFGTHMSAAEEVAPGVASESKAQGNAIFQLSGDGTSLSYKLIVANIHNVFQAHIHQGAFGSSGGVVVWLYPSTTPGAGPTGGGRIQGVIADGTITSAQLVGPLAGQDLSALVDLIKNGLTYVNVHTSDGVPPTNTGPGDFPGGEIRGQIEHRGH